MLRHGAIDALWHRLTVGPGVQQRIDHIVLRGLRDEALVQLERYTRPRGVGDEDAIADIDVAPGAADRAEALAVELALERLAPLLRHFLRQEALAQDLHE